jgi:hypothetical protein
LPGGDSLARLLRRRLGVPFLAGKQKAGMGG